MRTMIQKDLTREQAVAIAELIKEQCGAAYAELLAMSKPDPEVIEEFRTASYARRTASRLRSGLYQPKSLTGTVEELAQKYEYAAQYMDQVRDVRRLAKMHKQVKMHITNETFAEVRELFHRMKPWLRDPNVEELTAENILTLARERRRDLGRPKKKGPKIGEGGVLLATGAPAPYRR